jgi:hypothetical protein
MMVLRVMLSLVVRCAEMHQHCQIVGGWSSLHFSLILWMASLCAAGFHLEAAEPVAFASLPGSLPSLPRALEVAVVPDCRCDSVPGSLPSLPRVLEVAVVPDFRCDRVLLRAAAVALGILQKNSRSPAAPLADVAVERCYFGGYPRHLQKRRVGEEVARSCRGTCRSSY